MLFDVPVPDYVVVSLHAPVNDNVDAYTMRVHDAETGRSSEQDIPHRAIVEFGELVCFQSMLTQLLKRISSW